MKELYVDKWFKMPPKEKSEKYIVVKPSPKGKGKKYAKSRKKIKK